MANRLQAPKSRLLKGNESLALMSMRSRLSRITPLICQGCFLACFALTTPASAANWSLSKRVSLDTSFSDNIDLSDTNKASDIFASLRPGVVLQGDGRNLKLNLAYAPRFLYYFSESTKNRIENYLQADGNAKIYEDLLFLDLSASARQTFIDAFQARGDAENNTDNIQTTYTYTIAPRLNSNLGQVAEVLLRLKNTGVFYSKQETSDSYSYGGDFLLNSRRGYFSPWVWSLQANTETVEYDTGQNEFSDVSIRIGYELTPHLTFDLSAGYEDNKYASSQATHGSTWGTSLSWAPTSRTFVRASYTDHYYGSGLGFDFQHRSKRSTWSATYSRELETARSAIADTPVYTFEDAFGNPIIPDIANPSAISIDNALATSSVYTADRLSAKYALETRRSTLTANASYVHRDYGSATPGESAIQLGMNWNRRLSPKTTGFAGLNWRQTEQENQGSTSDTTRNEELALRTGLNRNLSEHLNVDFIYQLRNGEDYTENRVTFGIAADW